MSMWDYLLKIRGICNDLRAISEKVTSDDQIMAILASMGLEYNLLVVSVSFESITVEALQNLLVKLIFYKSKHHSLLNKKARRKA
ncbi:hypothetical protein L6164_028496 [Bauhinia variegata]|uniref:Uncharacterized protein n=1 Tax=Bauhinia variegata TaxID=167791 RepID=A0ACB9L5R9_BAUVA|nr:hypothetical protein L6164_028496 [Bauhinia variegata]